MTHEVVTVWFNEAVWLSHVDVNIQVAIQESSAHIHLMYLVVVMSRQRQQETNTCELGHRGECLMIVYACLLRVALGDKARLVSIDTAIGLAFDLNTHLQPIGCRPSGSSTSSHVPLR